MKFQRLYNVSQKGYLETVLDVFLKNLAIAIPNVIVVGLTSIIVFAAYILGYLSMIGASFMVSSIKEFPLSQPNIEKFFSRISLMNITFILMMLGLIAIVALIMVVIYAIAHGMMADMSLDAVIRGYTNLSKSFGVAKDNLIKLILVNLAEFFIIGLSLLPTLILLFVHPPLAIISILLPVLVGLAVGFLFMASPIFVVMGYGVIDSLKESADAMMKTFSLRIEVIIGIIVAFVISWIVSILGVLTIPFIYVLLAYYIVHDLKKLPPPPQEGLLI